jgi:hypothetical protein
VRSSPASHRFQLQWRGNLTSRPNLVRSTEVFCCDIKKYQAVSSAINRYEARGPHESALLKHRITPLAFSENTHETSVFDYNAGSGNLQLAASV